MSQYIEVATPAGKNYKSNAALTNILIFLGQKYKESHRSILVQIRRDYYVGLDYIAKECGKGYKTTIRNLNKSERAYTMFNANYSNWKFHKTKAAKFFKKLYSVLKDYKADDAVWLQFDSLYNELSQSFYIERRGSHIISCPYYSALNQSQNNPRYSDSEQKSLARVKRSFSSFDKLYLTKDGI